MWVGQYPEAASDDELADLKANVKAASARLDALRRDAAKLTAEIEQGSVSHARQREILESVALYRDEILNADEETKRYMLERLHVASRLRADDAGLWVDVGLQLDDEDYGSRFATIDLRTVNCDHTHRHADAVGFQQIDHGASTRRESLQNIVAMRLVSIWCAYVC